MNQTCSKKKRPAQVPAKGEPRFRIPLDNFYSGKRKRTSASCKKVSRAFQFGVIIENFIPFPRNIRSGQFVYTGAAGYRAVQR
jgi:hypothetical protein